MVKTAARASLLQGDELLPLQCGVCKDTATLKRGLKLGGRVAYTGTRGSLVGQTPGGGQFPRCDVVGSLESLTRCSRLVDWPQWHFGWGRGQRKGKAYSCGVGRVRELESSQNSHRGLRRPPRLEPRVVVLGRL